MAKPKAQIGHAHGLMQFCTQALADLKTHFPRWQSKRANLEALLAAQLRQSPRTAVECSLAPDAPMFADLSDGQKSMIYLTRASVASRALLLAKLLDETGYDVQAPPEERWAALIKCAAQLTAYQEWPPS
jgi:hypothetical protein